MSLTFYGLKLCDSCRAALKALQAAGIVVDVRDVRDDGVPETVLAAALASHGADRLVNKRSTTWRGLDQASRLMEPVALIAANPHGCEALFAQVFQDNPASARVLTNCGFQYLGDAETFSVARGANVPTWTYSRKLA